MNNTNYRGRGFAPRAFGPQRPPGPWYPNQNFNQFRPRNENPRLPWRGGKPPSRWPRANGPPAFNAWRNPPPFQCNPRPNFNAPGEPNHGQAESVGSRGRGQPRFMTNNSPAYGYHRGRNVPSRGGPRMNFGPRFGPGYKYQPCTYESPPPLLETPKTPALGSEEERQQKIAEAAKNLKQKLSTLTVDHLVNSSQENEIREFNSGSMERPLIGHRGIPELRHDPPELNLTVNDFRDIGRVDGENISYPPEIFILEQANFDETYTEGSEIDVHIVETNRTTDLTESRNNTLEFQDESNVRQTASHQSWNFASSPEPRRSDSKTETSERFEDDTVMHFHDNNAFDPVSTSQYWGETTRCKNEGQQSWQETKITSIPTSKDASSNSFEYNESGTASVSSNKNSTQSTNSDKKSSTKSNARDPRSAGDVHIHQEQSHSASSHLTKKGSSLPYKQQEPEVQITSHEDYGPMPPAFDPRISRSSCIATDTSTSTPIMNSNLVDIPVNVGYQSVPPPTAFTQPPPTAYTQPPPISYVPIMGNNYTPSVPLSTTIPCIVPDFVPQPIPAPMPNVLEPPPIPTGMLHMNSTASVVHNPPSMMRATSSNLYMNDELEEMQEALEFAKQQMNMNTRIEANIARSVPPPIMNSSIVRNPVLVPIVPPGLIPVPNIPETPKSNAMMQNYHKLPLIKPAEVFGSIGTSSTQGNLSPTMYAKPIVKQELVKQHPGSPSVYADMQMNQFLKVRDQGSAIATNDQRPVRDVLKTHPNRQDVANHRAQPVEQRARKDRPDEKSDNTDPRLMTAGRVNEMSSLERRIEESMRSSPQQSKETRKSTSVHIPQELPANVLPVMEKHRVYPETECTRRRATSQTPKQSATGELSWKERVINRFLRMSKNDICNMVNSSGMRKFDVAMKHLVKEKKSSLSRESRNSAEDMVKGCDMSREEFMSQLGAMLDPSAVVDIENLPSTFIKHLSEVLKLDVEMPATDEAPSARIPVAELAEPIVAEPPLPIPSHQAPVSQQEPANFPNESIPVTQEMKQSPVGTQRSSVVESPKTRRPKVVLPDTEVDQVADATSENSTLMNFRRSSELRRPSKLSRNSSPGPSDSGKRKIRVTVTRNNRRTQSPEQVDTASWHRTVTNDEAARETCIPFEPARAPEISQRVDPTTPTIEPNASNAINGEVSTTNDNWRSPSPKTIDYDMVLEELRLNSATKISEERIYARLEKVERWNRNNSVSIDSYRNLTQEEWYAKYGVQIDNLAEKEFETEILRLKMLTKEGSSNGQSQSSNMKQNDNRVLPNTSVEAIKSLEETNAGTGSIASTTVSQDSHEVQRDEGEYHAQRRKRKKKKKKKSRREEEKEEEEEALVSVKQEVLEDNNELLSASAIKQEVEIKVEKDVEPGTTNTSNPKVVAPGESNATKTSTSEQSKSPVSKVVAKPETVSKQIAPSSDRSKSSLDASAKESDKREKTQQDKIAIVPTNECSITERIAEPIISQNVVVRSDALVPESGSSLSSNFDNVEMERFDSQIPGVDNDVDENVIRKTTPISGTELAILSRQETTSVESDHAMESTNSRPSVAKVEIRSMAGGEKNDTCLDSSGGVHLTTERDDTTNVTKASNRVVPDKLKSKSGAKKIDIKAYKARALQRTSGKFHESNSHQVRSDAPVPSHGDEKSKLDDRTIANSMEPKTIEEPEESKDAFEQRDLVQREMQNTIRINTQPITGSNAGTDKLSNVNEPGGDGNNERKRSKKEKFKVSSTVGSDCQKLSEHVKQHSSRGDASRGTSRDKISKSMEDRNSDQRPTESKQSTSKYPDHGVAGNTVESKKKSTRKDPNDKNSKKHSIEERSTTNETMSVPATVNCIKPRSKPGPLSYKKSFHRKHEESRSGKRRKEVNYKKLLRRLRRKMGLNLEPVVSLVDVTLWYGKTTSLATNGSDERIKVDTNASVTASDAATAGQILETSYSTAPDDLAIDSGVPKFEYEESSTSHVPTNVQSSEQLGDTERLDDAITFHTETPNDTSIKLESEKLQRTNREDEFENANPNEISTEVESEDIKETMIRIESEKSNETSLKIGFERLDEPRTGIESGDGNESTTNFKLNFKFDEVDVTDMESQCDRLASSETLDKVIRNIESAERDQTIEKREQNIGIMESEWQDEIIISMESRCHDEMMVEIQSEVPDETISDAEFQEQEGTLPIVESEAQHEVEQSMVLDEISRNTKETENRKEFMPNIALEERYEVTSCVESTKRDETPSEVKSELIGTQGEMVTNAESDEHNETMTNVESKRREETMRYLESVVLDDRTVGMNLDARDDTVRNVDFEELEDTTTKVEYEKEDETITNVNVDTRVETSTNVETVTSNVTRGEGASEEQDATMTTNVSSEEPNSTTTLTDSGKQGEETSRHVESVIGDGSATNVESDKLEERNTTSARYEESGESDTRAVNPDKIYDEVAITASEIQNEAIITTVNCDLEQLTLRATEFERLCSVRTNDIEFGELNQSLIAGTEFEMPDVTTKGTASEEQVSKLPVITSSTSISSNETIFSNCDQSPIFEIESVHEAPTMSMAREGVDQVEKEVLLPNLLDERAETKRSSEVCDEFSAVLSGSNEFVECTNQLHSTADTRQLDNDARPFDVVGPEDPTLSAVGDVADIQLTELGDDDSIDIHIVEATGEVNEIHDAMLEPMSENITESICSTEFDELNSTFLPTYDLENVDMTTPWRTDVQVVLDDLIDEVISRWYAPDGSEAGRGKSLENVDETSEVKSTERIKITSVRTVDRDFEISFPSPSDINNTYNDETDNASFASCRLVGDHRMIDDVTPGPTSSTDHNAVSVSPGNLLSPLTGFSPNSVQHSIVNKRKLVECIEESFGDDSGETFVGDNTIDATAEDASMRGTSCCVSAVPEPRVLSDVADENVAEGSTSSSLRRDITAEEKLCDEWNEICRSANAEKICSRDEINSRATQPTQASLIASEWSDTDDVHEDRSQSNVLSSKRENDDVSSEGSIDFENAEFIVVSEASSGEEESPNQVSLEGSPERGNEAASHSQIKLSPGKKESNNVLLSVKYRNNNEIESSPAISPLPESRAASSLDSSMTETSHRPDVSETTNPEKLPPHQMTGLFSTTEALISLKSLETVAATENIPDNAPPCGQIRVDDENEVVERDLRSELSNSSIQNDGEWVAKTCKSEGCERGDVTQVGIPDGFDDKIMSCDSSVDVTIDNHAVASSERAMESPLHRTTELDAAKLMEPPSDRSGKLSAKRSKTMDEKERVKSNSQAMERDDRTLARDNETSVNSDELADNNSIRSSMPNESEEETLDANTLYVKWDRTSVAAKLNKTKEKSKEKSSNEEKRSSKHLKKLMKVKQKKAKHRKLKEKLTAERITDAVESQEVVKVVKCQDIPKVPKKPSTKEEVMARMIEIDVEIHKLMSEKMNLYQMLETGTLPDEESSNDIDESESVGNEASYSSPRCKTPVAIMTKIINNMDSDHSAADHPTSISTGEKPSQNSTESLPGKSMKIPREVDDSEDRHKNKKRSLKKEAKKSGSIEHEISKRDKTVESDVPEVAVSRPVTPARPILKKKSPDLSTVEQRSRELSDMKSPTKTNTNVKNKSKSKHAASEPNDDQSILVNAVQLETSSGKNSDTGSKTEHKKSKHLQFQTDMSIHSNDKSNNSTPEKRGRKETKTKKSDTLVAVPRKRMRQDGKTKPAKWNAILESVNFLTNTEDDMPLNKLSIDKLKQKCDLLKLMDEQFAIIDAVAENKIDEYQNPSVVARQKKSGDKKRASYPVTVTESKALIGDENFVDRTQLRNEDLASTMNENPLSSDDHLPNLKTFDDLRDILVVAKDQIQSPNVLDMVECAHATTSKSTSDVYVGTSRNEYEGAANPTLSKIHRTRVNTIAETQPDTRLIETEVDEKNVNIAITEEKNHEMFSRSDKMNRDLSELPTSSSSTQPFTQTYVLPPPTSVPSTHCGSIDMKIIEAGINAFDSMLGKVHDDTELGKEVHWELLDQEERAKEAASKEVDHEVMEAFSRANQLHGERALDDDQFDHEDDSGETISRAALRCKSLPNVEEMNRKKIVESEGNTERPHSRRNSAKNAREAMLQQRKGARATRSRERNVPTPSLGSTNSSKESNLPSNLRRRSKKRKIMTEREMASCKVRLVDCKYTYLKTRSYPSLHLRSKSSLGEPLNCRDPERVHKASTPLRVNLSGSDSHEEIEKKTTLGSPDASQPIQPDSSNPPPDEITRLSPANISELRDATSSSSSALQTELLKSSKVSGSADSGALLFLKSPRTIRKKRKKTVAEDSKSLPNLNPINLPRIVAKQAKVTTKSKPIVLLPAIRRVGTPKVSSLRSMTPTDNHVETSKALRPDTGIEDLEESTIRQDQSQETGSDDPIASPAVDNSNNVEELETPRVRYSAHKGPILDIKVFHTSFLAASEDGIIYRYSQKADEVLNTYEGHKAAVTCMCVVKTVIAGTMTESLYSSSLDGTLRCFDVKSGRQIRETANVGSSVQCMDQAWGMIFLGTKTGYVSRFHVKSNTFKGEPIRFSTESVLALKATTEGPRRVLIVASRSQPVTIRDAQDGLFLRTVSGHTSHTVYSLMMDNNLVYCGTSGTAIPVFDFINGSEVALYNAGMGIVCIQMYRRLLFAGCYDGNIYVFDTKGERTVCSIPGPGNMLLSMEIVKDKIIAGSKDRRLHIWQMPEQVLALLK